MRILRLICCFSCMTVVLSLVACHNSTIVKQKPPTATVSEDVSSYEFTEIIPDSIQKSAEIEGKAMLYKFNEHIFKLDVPYLSIYTSVFFINAEQEWYIIDTASSGMDVVNYIIPAANELGISLDEVKGILITHKHGDHSGGLSVLAASCPNAKIYGITSGFPSGVENVFVATSGDGFVIGNVIRTVAIKGHDAEVYGYLDTRTNTLISGDGLQLYGISIWGCQVRDVDAYYTSLENLKSMKIDNIIASHAFYPRGAYAIGAEESQKYIQDSIDALEILLLFTEGLYRSGTTDPEDIESQYVTLMKKQYPDFPTDGFNVAIKAIINARCK